MSLQKLKIITLTFLILVTTIVYSQDDIIEFGTTICVMDDIHLQDISGGITGVKGEIKRELTDSDKELGIRSVGEVNPNTRPTGVVEVIVLDDFTTPIEDVDHAHGFYVLEVAKGIIDNLQIDVDVSATDVDFSPDNRLSNVAQELADYLESSRADFHIVNMSWVLLPCLEVLPTANIQIIGKPLLIDIPLYMAYVRTPGGFNDCPEVFEEFEEGTLCFLLASHLEIYIDIAEEGEIEELYMGVWERFMDVDNTGVNLIDFMLTISDIEINEETFQAAKEELADLIEETETDTENTASLLEILDRDDVFGVGASGNFNDRPDPNRREPFAPASLEIVLAAGGVIAGDTTTMWEVSHSGQVTGVAAWHHFSTGEYGSGTSFAAPYVSAYVAIAAERGCDVTQLLNYAKDDNIFIFEALLDTCIN